MNDLLPSFLESPTMQLGLAAVAGVAAFGLTFAALRAFAGRVSGPKGPNPEDQFTPDPFTFGSRADRRSAHRRLGNPMPIWIAHKDEPHLDARVHDRSMGGLCLTAQRDFAPGTIIKVRPNTGSPTAPWVEVEVKSCLPHNSEWQIGCSFVKTPPYAVILMFG